MTIDKFCKKLTRVNGLATAQKAVAVLWFLDNESPGIEMSSGELAKILRENRVAKPNPTELVDRIYKTKCVFKNRNSFRIKESKKAEIRSWLESILDGEPEEIDVSNQYLVESVWKGTRGYIEKVCSQMNGCCYYHYYDGAAVLMRRIIETLIIECYEKNGNSDYIKDSHGNYFMLSGLVEKALSQDGLSLGREAKKALKEIKALGDRSAHNRRYNARVEDLAKIRDGLRIVVEELINIAELYQRK